jgi:hypothetical protein
LRAEFIRETTTPTCPFAVWKPFAGSPGGYAGGAFDAYRNSKNIPHLTVDDMTIYRHVDTDQAASARRHPSGTAETNRSSAVQIELVGFAGRPKNAASLRKHGAPVPLDRGHARRSVGLAQWPAEAGGQRARSRRP